MAQDVLLNYTGTILDWLVQCPFKPTVLFFKFSTMECPCYLTYFTPINQLKHRPHTRGVLYNVALHDVFIVNPQLLPNVSVTSD